MNPGQDIEEVEVRARSFGGHAVVASVPGKGTVVTLRLPIVRA